jgi:hypothetical protein
LYNRRCCGVRWELIQSDIGGRKGEGDEKLLKFNDASEGVPRSCEFRRREFFITEKYGEQFRDEWLEWEKQDPISDDGCIKKPVFQALIQGLMAT